MQWIWVCRHLWEIEYKTISEAHSIPRFFFSLCIPMCLDSIQMCKRINQTGTREQKVLTLGKKLQVWSWQIWKKSLVINLGKLVLCSRDDIDVWGPWGPLAGPSEDPKIWRGWVVPKSKNRSRYNEQTWRKIGNFCCFWPLWECNGSRRGPDNIRWSLYGAKTTSKINYTRRDKKHSCVWSSPQMTSSWL